MDLNSYEYHNQFVKEVITLGKREWSVAGYADDNEVIVESAFDCEEDGTIIWANESEKEEISWKANLTKFQ